VNNKIENSINVFGGTLQTCCKNPITGYYRNGNCDTGIEDRGIHTVCIVVNDKFLEFSKSVGNDLSTPIPEIGFSGLKAGDKWCLCALRWLEAYEANMAPHVLLESTHQKTLEYVPYEKLKLYGVINSNDLNN
tara:strand:+ start:149 stop:547 length:399 start_codon:yes stop_codon:yes gene_type:complete